MTDEERREAVRAARKILRDNRTPEEIERDRRYMKAYRAAHREERREYMRKWKAENPDLVAGERARARARRAERTPEEVERERQRSREYNRAWRKAHPDLVIRERARYYQKKSAELERTEGIDEEWVRREAQAMLTGREN